MKVLNTLSGKKEEFVPQGDEVTMYVCGINPYADAHIGHAMSYIFFDVVRRYLEFRGYKVKHVQNITDIEDNIIAHANELGVSVTELTQKYVERYDEDMEALNVMPAHIYPRAMGETDKMIEIVQGLLDKGFAYSVGGNVYFRVRNAPDYGKLSGRSLESMMAGARVEADEEKEHPMDFLLWKESKPGEPSWDSPWGKGRPGWHIECSAMSIRYLGEQIDIHGGGQDVLFPHHENEIAQSESFTDKKPFVKYWFHNGLLKMHETDEAKMSRSLGNLITIREALEKYSADAIRLFILGSYYRSPLTYSEEILEAAERGAERLLRAAAGRVPRPLGAKLEAEAYRERFIEAMDDDFSTPQALAVLFDLARDINRADETGMDTGDAQQILRELGSEVLGLKFEFRVIESSSFESELYEKSLSLEEYATMQFEDIQRQMKASFSRLEKNETANSSLLQSLRNEFAHGRYAFLDKAQASTEQYSATLSSLRYQLDNASKPSDLGQIQDSLRLLADCSAANIGSYSSLRDELRKEKRWEFADLIRNKLAEEGITLEDTPQGTVWKRRR